MERSKRGDRQCRHEGPSGPPSSVRVRRARPMHSGIATCRWPPDSKPSTWTWRLSSTRTSSSPANGRPLWLRGGHRRPAARARRSEHRRDQRGAAQQRACRGAPRHPAIRQACSHREAARTQRRRGRRARCTGRAVQCSHRRRVLLPPLARLGRGSRPRGRGTIGRVHSFTAWYNADYAASPDAPFSWRYAKAPPAPVR